MPDQQLELGSELRDRALATVRAHTDPAWRTCALAALRDLAEQGDVFGAYDLVLAGVPEPRHSSSWGALFNTAAKAGVITSAGARPSSRPTVKSSLARCWRGTTMARTSAPCPDCGGPVTRTHPVGRPPIYCPPCGAKRAHA